MGNYYWHLWTPKEIGSFILKRINGSLKGTLIPLILPNRNGNLDPIMCIKPSTASTRCTACGMVLTTEYVHSSFLADNETMIHKLLLFCDSCWMKWN